MSDKQQLEIYKEYVEAKIQINELPMTFDQFIKSSCEHEIWKCLDCGKVWEDVPPIGSCPDCASENIEETTKDEL